MERVVGYAPTHLTWQVKRLLLHHTRITGTPSKPNSPCGALLFNLVPVFTKELYNFYYKMFRERH